MNLLDRYDELMREAKQKGVDDQIHSFDIAHNVHSLAVLLGYRVPDALDPELPLVRS